MKIYQSLKNGMDIKFNLKWGSHILGEKPKKIIKGKSKILKKTKKKKKRKKRKT